VKSLHLLYVKGIELFLLYTVYYDLTEAKFSCQIKNKEND